MNDDLHTFIEPELQARITALVLGEASEFERDELEKLIAEKPELEIYRRRMQVMHDLLGDAVKPTSDDAWKLSADKRRKLRQTFTKKPEPAPRSIARKHGTARTQVRASVVIAACLMITCLLFFMATPVVMKQRKSSELVDIMSYQAESEAKRDEGITWSPEEPQDHAWRVLDNGRKTTMEGSVERKPAAPSSSLFGSIATNTTGTPAVPEASVAIPRPTMDHGGGDDFGEGFGNAYADPFGSDDRSSKLAANTGKQKDRVVRKEIPFLSLTDESEVSNIVTGGLRSGDYAITRHSIDAILNNPKRTTAGKTTDGLDEEIEAFKKKNNLNTSSRYAGYVALPDESKSSSGERRSERMVSSIAAKELARRSALVNEADQALLDGRKAYANKNYEKASGLFKEAVKVLPPGPALAERRDSLKGQLVDANIALSQQYRRVGKYEEAREVLEKTLRHDPTNSNALKQLGYLDDPIRTNSALSENHAELAKQVRIGLYQGEGYYNLGQYDKAEEEMKKVLQKDPYNKAARRWLEKVAATKSDYYRAAYDHTRAELLAEVDKAWELQVPKQLPDPMDVAGHLKGAGKKLQSKNAELQKQSGIVAEKRRKLMDIAEKMGVIWVESERGGQTIGGELELRQLAEKQLYEAEVERDQIKFQISKLLEVNDQDISSLAAELPDVGFIEAYNKFEKAKSELETAKASGLSSGHPDIKKREAMVNELKTGTQKRALEVRESLKHRLAIIDRRVQKMREVRDKKQDQGTDRARALEEFNKVRKEYETAQSIKDRMQIEHDIQRARSGLKPAEKKIKPSVRPKALPEETLTRAEPYSTFSLNVNDVSFKLARVALLEKGEWPDAAKVRTEEFVNAFDYGDPSPARGEPVSCAVEQAAHPFLQQRNLLRIGMKTAAMGRSQPLRLTVLLDNSGSMEREDREASVLAAMQVLASQLGPQDVITVIGFARQPRMLADRLSGDQAAKIVEIIAKTPSEGGTNLEEALRLGRTLAKRQHTAGAQSRVVLITDGVANLGNTVPAELSLEVETMRQQGIAFDACGVGAEGLNDDILEALTRKGDGRYYFLNRPEDADAGFAKQLAGALTPAAKNVKVQVVFNPERVTRYRLLGFEKHRLNKEDFRNDKVDAAEMAAEEAGNAVYQIEVNPEGVGELGEVFVRFLDASTGRMVERSWPLPYESKARSFDLAPPAMQLAGTAAMLGEKLHGTDAGSVRFSMIANTLGKLSAHYTADPRVQDLIRMCRKVE